MKFSKERWAGKSRAYKTVKPKKKDPEGENRLCKHTYAVLNKIK